ncbi:MAG TPA: MerR family DNA-binding transcriptional regulator [Myxococcaceae bacterium]|nr:MerR family DNA-binding transcriptional regulator [Myxococcaceae bacterium]
MRIGELSRLTRVSPDMLRHYERMGLLPKPPRSSGGYREYPASAVKRVQAIRAAVWLGFGLDELAQAFRMRDRGGAPCSLVRALAGKKLEAIEEQLRELTRHKKLLADVLTDWDDRLTKVALGTRLGLLEALAARPDIAAVSARRPRRERFGHRKLEREMK